MCRHRDDRDDGSTAVEPVPVLAKSCAAGGSGSMSMRRTRARPRSAAAPPPFAGGSGRPDRHEPAQWLGPDGLLGALDTTPDGLRRAFGLVPSSSSPPDDALNLTAGRFRSAAVSGAQALGGAALLWAGGLQERTREHIRLAELFERWVDAEPGWEVVAPRHFSLVCFRREASDEDNERLLERVNASGEVFLSHTRLDGRYVLRWPSATSARPRTT